MGVRGDGDNSLTTAGVGINAGRRRDDFAEAAAAAAGTRFGSGFCDLALTSDVMGPV
jgi:hypothetical protein